MAPRSNWKGYLKLSLVSCPVQLFPATTTKERVSFHLLHRDTGNRLRRKLVDPETDEEVASDEQVRGYQVAKNEYVILEEEEIDSVAIESTHTIDIETFVPRDEIDETFLDTPYYLTPDGKLAEEAFAVIREAMRQKNVVGLGRVVLYRRERPIMLEPRGKGLVATTLRYAYEVREDEDYFENIGEPEVSEEMLDLATHIIGRKMSHFDPKRFEDRYQNALLDLIKAKQTHQPIKVNVPAKPSNVVSLMDALRRSISAEQDNGKAEKADKAPARAKAAKPAAEAKPAKPAADPKPKAPVAAARRAGAKPSPKLKKAS
ncbi:Ku protein [Enterovirga aerilata]|uniref:Non-homologous end joining protein Ku n=1 Tax=Enterovirga aerilata TaxID=2730920 RepID=A0A849IL28_9HYPH|nr:Ku protein [Enterovirga sp. DB1703]NNM74653.1 Ku protein [Enterovirga sp. DB1703]